jgi:hypothetical protein
VEFSSLRPYFRHALAHSIAVVWFACLLAYGAGFALAAAVHRLHDWLAAQAAAVPGPDPQQESAISGWEAEIAAGRWVEPTPVEPLFSGSWWDLIDPGELDEAEQEPPLRWAV